MCDDKLNEPANNSYPGKTLDPSKFLQYFNDAKENDGKKCVETCNSDESERVKIRKEGVFTHIAKDYSLANLANVTQTKQYATNWITSDKEGYEKLATFFNTTKSVTRVVSGYYWVRLITY